MFSVAVLLATVFECYWIVCYTEDSVYKDGRPRTWIVCLSLRYNLMRMVTKHQRYIQRKGRPSPLATVNNSVESSQASNVIEMDTSTTTTVHRNSLASPGGHEPVGLSTGIVDAIKTLALVWICVANYFLLGYQSQMLPSVGKSIRMSTCMLQWLDSLLNSLHIFIADGTLQ